MIQITAREFRSKQAAYMDLAETQQVVVTRRGKPSIILTTVCEDDFRLTPELEAKIEQGRKELKEGKTLHFESAAEAIAYFDAL